VISHGPDKIGALLWGCVRMVVEGHFATLSPVWPGGKCRVACTTRPRSSASTPPRC